MVQELKVKCPLCGGKIVERKSKKGRKFYGCSNYPNCNFLSWDKPIEERCPKCGGILVEKNNKSGKSIKCINKDCGYTRLEKNNLKNIKG